MRTVCKATWIVTILAVFGTQGLFAAHTKTPYRSTKRRAHMHRAVRRVVWNPVLRGSHESMLRQNYEIDRLQLQRISNDDELLQLEQRQDLVYIDDTHALVVASNIEDMRRYVRPWTLQFLTDLSEAHYKEFHRPIMLTSAVRTVEQQAKLRHHNKNAAPIDGETASSHLAGLTIDLGKRGMTRAERKWIDNYLLEMQETHIIEAAEERRQACYHIMVSQGYNSWRDTHMSVASNAGAKSEPSVGATE